MTSAFVVGAESLWSEPEASKQQLHRELDLPFRICSAGDYSKVWILARRIGLAKHDRVTDIEGVRSEIEIEVFANGEAPG